MSRNSCAMLTIERGLHDSRFIEAVCSFFHYHAELHLTSFISCIYEFVLGPFSSTSESTTRVSSIDKPMAVGRYPLMLGLQGEIRPAGSTEFRMRPREARVMCSAGIQAGGSKSFQKGC